MSSPRDVIWPDNKIDVYSLFRGKDENPLFYSSMNCQGVTCREGNFSLINQKGTVTTDEKPVWAQMDTANSNTTTH